MQKLQQIIIRTFYKGQKIGKRYFDEHNLTQSYPDALVVINKRIELLNKIKPDETYYIDIDENGIHTNLNSSKLYPDDDYYSDQIK